MSNRPNIILLMADQWRGDCLSVSGHPIVHTPSLDRLSLSGVRFDQAYSATPTCTPARASLFTGQRPATHGRVGMDAHMPWDYTTTLASEFTRHGYQTEAVGKTHFYPERTRMGFQHIILHSPLGIVRSARQRGIEPDRVDDYLPWLRQQLGRDATYFDHGIDSNSYIARPWDKPEYTHPTNFVATHAADFFRRRDPTSPFFLFASFNAPHPPYDPPAWAFEQYLHQPMPQTDVGNWIGVFNEHARDKDPTAHVANIAPHHLQRARAGYYGHISHVDHQIGYLLEMLDQYDLRNNTYICFLSDHGEMLGQHHLFRKGYPYEGSAHIPLILAGPASSGFPRGAIMSDRLVELRDVMPTLLECAGLPIPESVEGRSLLPLTRNENQDWRTRLHGEHTTLGQSLQWVTDGHEKYVWHSRTGHEQLFNLDTDPHELDDLTTDPRRADHLSRWREILIEELCDREEGFVDKAALVPGKSVNPTLSHLRRRVAVE